jgi:predicted TIM-barrel fold metal-dependent hydrolase
MAHNGYKVIDCDLHVMEPADLWQRYIDPKYRDQAPVGSATYFMDMNLMQGGKYISRDGRLPIMEGGDFTKDLISAHGGIEKYKIYDKRGWGPDTQLEAMDDEGIDKAVLFPTRGFYAIGKEYADDNLAAAIARAYNDWLVQFCAKAPDRMLGCGLIAPQSIDKAIAEVRRMKRELGFKCVFLRPNPVRRRNWHDPAYDPLWEAIQQEGLAIGFHEGWPSDLPVAMGERFDGSNEDLWMTEHVACHPVEAMYACLCFIMGGILARFPGLRVGFLESNCSWLPFWLWRMDEHYEHREHVVKGRMPLRPSEYFKRHCYVSIEAEEKLGKNTVDYIGDSNIVFSTDYPHEDSRYPHALETFDELPLGEESKKKILWDNSARLYNLD